MQVGLLFFSWFLFLFRIGWSHYQIFLFQNRIEYPTYCGASNLQHPIPCQSINNILHKQRENTLQEKPSTMQIIPSSLKQKKKKVLKFSQTSQASSIAVNKLSFFYLEHFTKGINHFKETQTQLKVALNNY